jgi:patatin-like phospholipase/acyl hydrolase
MNEPSVRLLSIDGGGVRGISALVLLEQLMEHVNDQRDSKGFPKQEPWELFDMMGGTSTGGYAVAFRLAEVTVADPGTGS